jgi:hypothetical protein
MTFDLNCGTWRNTEEEQSECRQDTLNSLTNMQESLKWGPKMEIGNKHLKKQMSKITKT